MFPLNQNFILSYLDGLQHEKCIIEGQSWLANVRHFCHFKVNLMINKSLVTKVEFGTEYQSLAQLTPKWGQN